MSNFSGTIFSNSLKKNTRLNIIFPDNSNDVDPEFGDEVKVIYLLHGLSGNCDEWMRFSKIEYYAKKYNFVIIMPDVDRSFYCNTKTGLNYFDYITYELPEIISKWFKISNKKEDTFIAGESMGGYGAVKVGLSRIEMFNAIASLSGVLDYQDFSKKIYTGDFPIMTKEELTILEDEETPIELAKKVTKKGISPRLIQLCGSDDFLLEENRKFDSVLNEIGFNHVYIESEGDHSWPYWDKAIQYAFMYFLNLDMDITPIY